MPFMWTQIPKERVTKDLLQEMTKVIFQISKIFSLMVQKVQIL
uniref:Uncharacterized protein n=1 Tax=Anguilla anguilla TaxID=7936 RepID=A0A0E9XLA3_ANGAN